VAWVCERASEKPCNKLDISHWYMMGLWKAPWWHLGMVSTSTLLLGEDGQAERGVPATARAAELASQVQQEQSERAELDCPPIGWIGCKPARGPRQRAQSDRQKRSLGVQEGAGGGSNQPAMALAISIGNCKQPWRFLLPHRGNRQVGTRLDGTLQWWLEAAAHTVEWAWWD
jgi:hypothetical protein